MSKYQVDLAENQSMETERLWLRPLTLADVDDMFEYASDEKCVKYVFPKHITKEDTRESIAAYFMAAPLGKYALELKSSGKMIGTIDLRIIEEKNSGEIGYTLNRNYWNQGYMSEAALALVALGFEQLQLIKIFAMHDIDNLASGRLMEKIGMEYEGTVKNARIAKGKIVTDIYRGITIEAWRAKNA
jgi:ribosomal-protein-alanine N-acetyltransferase